MDFSTLKQLSKIYPILVKPFDLFDATTVTDQDIQTKIDSVIQYMNSLGQSNNDTVRSWNKVMQWVMDEGLTDSVNAKIDDMMAIGTFNDLLTTLTNSLLGSEVLTTTNQDVKGAINEVKGIADANTLALGSEVLATTNKDVKGAINEVKGIADSNTSQLADIATNVRSKGAKGDGVTDDRPAIQAAIDYVASLPNGGTILIPDGYTFVLNSFSDSINKYILLLRDKVSIIGKGTLKIANGFGDYDAVFAPATNLSNVAYKDFTVDDNTTNNPMVNIPAVGTNVNNRIVMFLWQHTFTNVTIDGIVMKDCLGVWQITSGASTQLTIKNCKLYYTDTYPNNNYDRTSIYFGGTKGVITGNMLFGKNFGWTGLEIHGTHTVCSDNIFDSYNRAIIVANDVVESPSMENVTVSDNIITNTRKGISLWFQSTTPVNQVKVHGNNLHINPNKINDPTGASTNLQGFGIQFYDYVNSPSLTNIEIVNNSVYFDIATGLSVDPSGLKYSGIGLINYTTNLTYTLENLKIIGNTIKNSVDSGIHIEMYGTTTMKNLLVQNNVIIDAGQTSGKSGIKIARIPKFFGCKVQGNTITDGRATLTMAQAIQYLNDGALADDALNQLEFIDNDVNISDTNYTNGVNSSLANYLTFSYACYVKMRMVNIGNYAVNIASKVGSLIEDIATGRVYRQTTSPSGTNWISESYGSSSPSKGYFNIGAVVKNTNPVLDGNSAWICTSAGNVSSQSWVASTAYNVGDQVINSENRIYICTIAGTSGSTGPLGNGSSPITDGTSTWKYLSFTGGFRTLAYATTVKMGTSTTNGDGTTNSISIVHGLGGTPTNWQVTPASVDVGTAGIKYVDKTSSALIVYFNNVKPTGTNNIVLNWKAEI